MAPPVYMNLGACLINLGFFLYGRNHVNLGCAVITGSFAAAFYFFPPGIV